MRTEMKRSKNHLPMLVVKAILDANSTHPNTRLYPHTNGPSKIINIKELPIFRTQTAVF